MIGKRLGHYRIVAEIGAGGMGVVYRGRDEHLHRDVAVKVLPAGTLSDEAARRRFRQEALALSRLNHGNIESVYDFDTQDGVDFLVLEYVEGESLEVTLKHGPLSERETTRLGVQLGRGLVEAHAKGVIHRDLKPANLRVTPAGTLKILDFGLAALRAPGGERGHMTQTREENAEVRTATLSSTAQGWGTLPYMPPEQLRGEATDARTDLHAAGAVLYEMATGRKAFPETQMPLLVDAILHQVPASPRTVRPQLSPALEAVIQKALEKDPERRYQTAKDLCVDLERAEAPLTQPTPAPPSPASAPPVPSPVRGIWRYAVAAVVTVAAALVVWKLQHRPATGQPGPVQIASLAVLPLANLSGDPAQEYFADGMTEELITSLAKIGGLRVTSRSSSMQYKNRNEPARAIGHELGVDALVEGSVRRSGNLVRITARLVHAASDQDLWSDSYERREVDVLSLQCEVARAIANGIQLELTPEERARLSESRSVDPAAHEAYLKGSYYWNSYAKEDAEKALAYFQQAVDADSGYAEAYAALAGAYWGASNLWLPPAEAMSKARQAATRALELDETLADAHACMGIIKTQYDWDFAGGESEYRRAIELNPSHVIGHRSYAYFLIQLGRFDEAAAHLHRAQDLDPKFMLNRWWLAWIPFYSRQYDEAIRQLQGLIQMDSTYAAAYQLLGETLEQQGRLDESLVMLERSYALEPIAWTLAAIGRVHALAGRKKEAREALDRLAAMSKRTYVSPYGPATVHACLGQVDAAFALLQEGYLQRCEDLLLLRVDPRMDRLRTDPRVRELLQRVGLATGRSS